MMMHSKKAAYGIQDLLPIALLLVVTTIGIAIGADVLTNIQDNQVVSATACGTNISGGTGGTILYTNCSYAYNITGEGLQAQDELGSWLDTIALIVAAAIIIGVLVTSFMIGTSR